MPDARTIFDIGLHEGTDAEFYLRKGFRVVSVEANPQLATEFSKRHSSEIDTGRLRVINKAVAERSGELVAFYISSGSMAGSSIYRELAERNGIASQRIEVETVTIADLFAEYGVPYYMKCDIEGADDLVMDHLARVPERPRFASFELNPDGNAIDSLKAAGYSRFQLVNQSYHDHTPAPKRREGDYAEMSVPGEMTGLFGEERPAHWVDAETARQQLRLWVQLSSGKVGPIQTFLLRKYGKWTGRTWLINRGWLDIHAAHNQ